MYRLGNYIPAKSLIHRLDPRVKIMSVISLSITVLFAAPFGALLISLFLAASLPLAGISPRRLWQALAPVRPFLLLLLLLHMLGTGGEPLPPFPIWKITVTAEGIATGFIIAWRFGLLVTAAAVLTITTSPSELVAGLQKLLKPLGKIGVPVRDLTTMVSLALRFVPTLLAEVDRMKDAQLARGGSITAGKISGRLRAARSLVLPVVLNSFKRADELAVAMEARAYGAGPGTSMMELSIGKLDVAASSLVAMVSLLAPIL
ncbi:MAG: energy-coupling factor transporter transmembrane component T [Desulfatiglandaceae bacterium]